MFRMGKGCGWVLLFPNKPSYTARSCRASCSIYQGGGRGVKGKDWRRSRLFLSRNTIYCPCLQRTLRYLSRPQKANDDGKAIHVFYCSLSHRMLLVLCEKGSSVAGGRERPQLHAPAPASIISSRILFTTGKGEGLGGGLGGSC